ncbi:anthranilate phosphoribosyltransferase [Campylobacter concisus]|uniref:anthranilate phosphoribosyltransferase n=1 Tax=Campylobacter concisus TaxID=199 RepID=UPI0018834D6E|nr:anthranilate phosphoribosyltransferase [Campylobacter concisus]MBE9818076.1 anthranilate phosphoribosyltransferase [Campylobacter concisus]
MILLIDNYDSFVFNVEQYVKELTDEEVRCVRNDKITLDEIKKLNPSKIILSPGPKHPKDSGVCLEILKADLGVPVLGICLGHQAIGLNYGAKIKRLDDPLHGKTSFIDVKNKEPLFAGLPERFEVMRYHSLYVDELPASLSADAVSDDGVVMALSVKDKPIFGIQFHPESYFTQYGKKIVENFVNYKAKDEVKEPKIRSLKPYLIKLQDSIPLDDSDFEQICEIIASKEYEIVQLSALLVLISEKSLYPKSLAALAKNILKYSQTYRDDTPMIDLCGTGGDGFKTINISTTVAFILASLGIKVAKHGNKAVSSKSGSSDVLEILGVKSEKSLAKQRENLASKNLAFFHAPFFHPLVGEVREVRQRLGIRTVFNVLGPLLNPNLNLTNQLVGVYHKPVLKLYAQTLKILGRKHALVVRGDDGLDEITLCSETSVVELKNGEIFEYSITPEQFGFKRALHSDIEGGTSEENAKTLIRTLKGEEQGVKFDIVVFNAMFALYAADGAKSLDEAKNMVLEAINSGKAYKFYEEFIKAEANGAS